MNNMYHLKDIIGIGKIKILECCYIPKKIKPIHCIEKTSESEIIIIWKTIHSKFIIIDIRKFDGNIWHQENFLTKKEEIKIPFNDINLLNKI